MFGTILFSAFASCALLIQTHEERSFLSWMRQFNCFYTGDEYNLRLGIYLANARYVAEHNKRTDAKYKLALNKFSTYTQAEYASLLGHRESREYLHENRPFVIKPKITGDEIPDSVDWRNKGVVNEIQDQGNCGSCWAFGTIQACETANALVSGKLYKCSEQNMLDCVRTCAGCSGGFEYKALNYIIANQEGWLNLLSDYPYTATSTEDYDCKYDATKKVNHVMNYAHGSFGNETYLQILIAQGVCDVAIDALSLDFQQYSGGIFTGFCSNRLNHAVGCIGYGTDADGTDYWIVRNTYGKSWGEEGYIRMIRGTDVCGIANDALQPYSDGISI